MVKTRYLHRENTVFMPLKHGQVKKLFKRQSTRPLLFLKSMFDATGRVNAKAAHPAAGTTGQRSVSYFPLLHISTKIFYL
jgi:hypothetical protein